MFALLSTEWGHGADFYNWARDSVLNTHTQHPASPQLFTEFILISVIHQGFPDTLFMWAAPASEGALCQQMALQNVQHPQLPSPHSQQLLWTVFFCFSGSSLVLLSGLYIGVSLGAPTPGPSNFPGLSFQKRSLCPAAQKKNPHSHSLSLTLLTRDKLLGTEREKTLPHSPEISHDWKKILWFYILVCCVVFGFFRANCVSQHVIAKLLMWVQPNAERRRRRENPS